jgi:hypothetical protein
MDFKELLACQKGFKLVMEILSFKLHDEQPG